MSSRYIIDKDDFRIRKDRPSVRSVFMRVLKYLVVSVGLAVIYYIVFALFISTDTERRLKQENRMFEKLYPEMEEKEALLGDVVTELQQRDNSIYGEIFHSAALPSMDFGYADFVSGGDSVSDEGVVRYTEMKLASAEKGAAKVDAAFRYILEKCASMGDSLPPLHLPLKDFSYAQTGASVGSKINPFYKVPVSHDGLDLLVPTGTPVYASAAGVVVETVRSGRGSGNVVVIDHGNGYVTRYAHLKEIHVRRGRHVEMGDKIGLSGMTGRAFAPHLHYTVMKDTVVLDPLNHFFGSVTPETYMEMMILGESIAQSMD